MSDNKLFDYSITKDQLEIIFLLFNKNIDSDYFDSLTIKESYIYIGYINSKPVKNICIKYTDEKNNKYCLSCEFSKIYSYE